MEEGGEGLNSDWCGYAFWWIEGVRRLLLLGWAGDRPHLERQVQIKNILL